MSSAPQVIWLRARDDWAAMGVKLRHLRRALPSRARPDQVFAPRYNHDAHLCGLGRCYMAIVGCWRRVKHLTVFLAMRER